MAKDQLPKAQLGGLAKAYQGAKAGFKLASKIKTRAKNIKAIGIAKKEKAVIDAAAKAEKAKKAAEIRAATKAEAAEAAAKNSKTGTTKTGTTKKSTTSTTTPTPTPPASKGKEPFVKSKNRQKLENMSGKLIGGVTFGTGNVVKKVLKNRIAQGIIGGGTTAYVMNRIAEGRKPVKIKKIKKK